MGFYVSVTVAFTSLWYLNIFNCDPPSCRVKGPLSVQLPAGGVGGPQEVASPVHVRHHEELQLQSPSAGQQQRLWTLFAAVCRELPTGEHTHTHKHTGVNIFNKILTKDIENKRVINCVKHVKNVFNYLENNKL